jgi:hypothetical protein
MNASQCQPSSVLLGRSRGRPEVRTNNNKVDAKDHLAPSLPHGPADLPPDLALAASAWPSLPEPIRRAVLALVEAGKAAPCSVPARRERP